MRKIEINQKYRHFKGIIIRVICIAKHSESLDELVIYEHLETGELWARPIEMFLDETDISNKEGNITGQKYRFELIEE